MGSRVSLFAILLALCALTATRAVAEKRVALVIGNSAYQNAPVLPKTAGDAQAMTEAFRTQGFDVVDGRTDLNNVQFVAAIQQFQRAAAASDIAVVYYAGYSVEISGTRYLIPVDAKPANGLHAANAVIPMNDIIGSVQGAKLLGLVILEACRDGPFAPAAAKAGKTGLGATELKGSNVLVAYAAKNCSGREGAAYDGDAGNSPFTAASLAHLFEPGLDIRLALGRVRSDVLKMTANRQEPFVYGSLFKETTRIGSGVIALAPAAPQPAQTASTVDERTPLAAAPAAPLPSPLAAAPAAPLPSPPTAAELQAWDRIKDTNDPEPLIAFILAYPSSSLKHTAQLRLDQILDQIRKAEAAKKAEQTRLDEQTKAERDAKAAQQTAELKAALLRAAEARPKQIEEKANTKPEPQTISALPNFPWPPPGASAYYVLPQSLFGKQKTVGEETEAIVTALERNGYVERSFYSTPAGGVALVTRLERINDDGSPAAAGDRWPNGEFKNDPLNLVNFLLGLFYAEPGRYRVIVFIVQDQPFAQSAEKSISGVQARQLLMSGANVLPPEIAERLADKSHCTALIYEFANDGTTLHKVESRLNGMEHLMKAGVLAVPEKAN